MKYYMKPKLPVNVEYLSGKYRKDFYKYLEGISKIKLSKVDLKSANQALKSFMYNCHESRKHQYEFTMTLLKNNYSTGKNNISYTYTRKVINYFSQKGLITLDIGEVISCDFKVIGGKCSTKPYGKPTKVTLNRGLKEIIANNHIIPLDSSSSLM